MLARRLSMGIGFCVAAAFLSGGAWAAEGGHKAHVHGESKVKLAIEGNVVEIEFESPAHDIVGFESMPKTAKQRAAVEAAVAALKKGEALFRLTPDAGCKLQEAEVETPLADSGHKGEHKHSEEEEHSEFHAEYRFRCAQPARLKGVEVLLFDSFRTMREIEVSAILPGGQRAASLKPGANRFDF
ncbi:MAG: DUF2796 domain-containing protein [Defluviicoccus sp.]|nr:DUF2796 domain-containing protein [Defluviicoccus sp.]